MGNSPAFQLYSADFYMDTNDWEVDEVGIYTRLLLTEWINGGLPNDERRLARIAGCSTKKFQKGWTIIKIKFHLNGEGKLVNPKMEEVRQNQEDWRKNQIESGRLGGLRTQEKKRNKPSDPSSDPSSDRPSENQALQSSSSTSLKEKDLKASFNKQGGNGKSAFLEKLEDDKKNEPLFKEIEKLSLILRAKGIWNKAPDWARMKIQLQEHPGAILQALESVNKNKPKSPEAYVEKFIREETQNHNEDDHIAESAKYKVPGQIGNIIAKLTKDRG